MSRRYRRNRSYRNSGSPNPVGLLILLALCLFYNHWKKVLIVALIIGVCLLLWYWIKRRKNTATADNNDETANLLDSAAKETDVLNETADSPHQTYTAKGSIMTDCEREFYSVFKEIIEPKYIIQPQINLASIIDKDSHHRYQNELFRNIDFGIFDNNYALVLLIEINDQTHTQKNRIARDSKVRSICEEAGIPLITFWTKYGINKKYIRDRLSPYLPQITIADPVLDEGNKEPFNYV